MRRSLTHVLGLIAATAVIATGATACGGSDGGATPPAAVAAGACQISVSTDLDTKPTISVPACMKKPAQLVTTTVVAGTGDAAKAGDSVVVRYYGASYSSHKQFDASWDRGGKSQTFTVAPLGTAGVIDGWNKGLIGAKVGERRLLVIPPDQGYGPQGSPPDIAPNETLIFVVDVVTISSGS